MIKQDPQALFTHVCACLDPDLSKGDVYGLESESPIKDTFRQRKLLKKKL